MPVKNTKNVEYDLVCTEPSWVGITSVVLRFGDVSFSEKRQLEEYSKLIKRGELGINALNGVQVGYRYDLGYRFDLKGLKRGRLLASGPSLQNMSKKVINTIIKKNAMFVVSISIDDLDVVLLSQYCCENNIKCKKLDEYLDNYDKIVKKVKNELGIKYSGAVELIEKSILTGKSDCDIDFIKNLVNDINKTANEICLNEPGIYEYLKTYENSKFLVIKGIISDMKSKIFLSLSELFRQNGLKTYCIFEDSILLQNDNGACSISMCEKHVKKVTGYEIALTHDNFDDRDTYTVPKHVDPFVNDDKEAQLKLFEIVGKENFHFCEGHLYVFDDRHGIYKKCTKNDQTAWQHYVIDNRQSFLKKRGKDSHVSYGCELSLLEKIGTFIKNDCINDKWLKKTALSSLGYLLFKNGIYNFKTGEFVEGFNNKIVFHFNVPHKFPKRNEENMKYARKLTFDKYGSTPEDSEKLLFGLARAMAGDRLKKLYFLPGVTNSGKSYLCHILGICFGDYVATFPAGDLTSSNDSKDEALRYKWLASGKKRFARVFFSNEIKKGVELDGNDLKKISSGCDKIVGRCLFDNDTDIALGGNFFLSLNDIPVIKPFDRALDKRIDLFEFKNEFVPGLKKRDGNKFPEDKDIDEKIKSREFIDGFIWLILDAYQRHLNGESYPFDEIEKTEWFEDSKDGNIIAEIIGKYYVFTQDESDTVPLRDVRNIKDTLHKKDLNGMSLKRFNDAIVNLGGIQKKIGATRYWTHMKEINNDDD